MSRAAILSDRQKTELNKAVLQYIEPFITASQFEQIRSALTPLNDDPIIQNFLEKKWGTVGRLQHENLKLRTENEQLRKVVLSQTLPDQLEMLKDKINWLPQIRSKKFDTVNAQVVNLVVIHPYRAQISAGCADGTLIVWNLVDDESNVPHKIIKAHTTAINCLMWSRTPIQFFKKPKTSVIALCSSDLLIKIWDGDTFTELRSLEGHKHIVLLVAWLKLRPETLYLVLKDNTIRIWDVVNGTHREITGHLDWVRAIDVASADENWQSPLGLGPSLKFGDFILTSSNDGLVRLTHAKLATAVAQALGHNHVVETVKFLPKLSNSYIDKFLEDNINLFPDLPTELISSAVFCEELGYKYCISGGRDNSIKLWLLPPPEIVPDGSLKKSRMNNSRAWLIAELNEHSLWVKCLSIHPLGRFFFSGSDDKLIKIWDLAGLKSDGKINCVRTLIGHENFVNSVDFARVDVELEQVEAENITEANILSHIEEKLRKLLVLAGLDNLVYLWK